MEQITASTAELRRRKRIAPDARARGFWPSVLGLGALLLLGSSALAARWVENDVLEAAHRALSQEERAWARLKAHGRELIVTGIAPSDGAASEVTGKLQVIRGPTLFGPFKAPRRVVAIFEKGKAACAPTVDPAARVNSPSTADTVATSSVAYFLRKANQVLVLRGRVESPEDRDEVLAKAQTLLQAGEPPIQRIDDHLAWAGGPPLPQQAWLRGLELLELCREGRLQAAEDGDTTSLDVLCVAPNAHRPKIEAILQEDVFQSARPLQTSLISAEEVDSCEARLSALLKGTVIEFDSGSARIRRSSFRLLHRVANVAKRCPGRLRIEGHTDRRGDAAYNLDLSQKRADAVAKALKARGLVGDRLRTEGFGETQPLNAKGTAAALQKNRRIEIHVIGS